MIMTNAQLFEQILIEYNHPLSDSNEEQFEMNEFVPNKLSSLITVDDFFLEYPKNSN